jgi:hypothetical protein
MTGRAISSSTSGGTGAGPGVNKYCFEVFPTLSFTFFFLSIWPHSYEHRNPPEKTLLAVPKKSLVPVFYRTPDPNALLMSQRLLTMVDYRSR